MRRKLEKAHYTCLLGLYFLNFWNVFVKTFPTSTALYTKKVDFRLILTILIFHFAVPKLATQLLHHLLIFLTHLTSAMQV